MIINNKVCAVFPHLKHWVWLKLASTAWLKEQETRSHGELLNAHITRPVLKQEKTGLKHEEQPIEEVNRERAKISTTLQTQDKEGKSNLSCHA